MTLSDEYERQFAWRSWGIIFDALPQLGGRTVLDLGCGLGEQTAELASRGARVLGVDWDDALLALARSKGIPNAQFQVEDFRSLSGVGTAVDGIWCSFAAAYDPDLSPTLWRWRQHHKPDGWIALTEIDELFGHEPLDDETRAVLAQFTSDALITNRYDFQMGRKLTTHLERSGFTISTVLTLPDRELSFDGPATPEVLVAWRLRLQRMTRLKEFCGPAFDGICGNFLGALAHPEHRAIAKVYSVIATVARTDRAGQFRPAADEILLRSAS
jgi:SAM-dependent methyltransferase